MAKSQQLPISSRRPVKSNDASELTELMKQLMYTFAPLLFDGGLSSSSFTGSPDGAIMAAWAAEK
jgi:hypothetical protein